jgi:hypothetical protein
MISEPRGQRGEEKNTLTFSKVILPNTPAWGGRKEEQQTVYSFILKFSEKPFSIGENNPTKHNNINTTTVQKPANNITALPQKKESGRNKLNRWARLSQNKGTAENIQIRNAETRKAAKQKTNRVTNSMRKNVERIRKAREVNQAKGWWKPNKSRGNGGTRMIKRSNRTQKVKQLTYRQ